MSRDGATVGDAGGSGEAERVRTDLFCHNCDGNFLSVIDLRLTGNHIIFCPHCGHQHCRLVVDGKVTDDRWDSNLPDIKTMARDTIALKNRPVTSGTAAAFLRDRWVNRG